MTEFADYATMHVHLGELNQQGRYEDAIELLQGALEQFPDHVLANSYNLAYFCCFTKEYDKGIKALQYGLDHGVWFGYFTFMDDMWAPYKEFEQFKQIEAACEERRQEAQKHARPELVTLTPSGYSDAKAYPLLIALHGGGSNMQELEDNWKSEKLDKEFIVALLQSSQIVDANGFAWMDFELAKKEIRDAYRAVVEKYSIKAGETIIGGFSSGGRISLAIALDGALSVQGFIALCPRKPENYSLENIKRAGQRGVRGTILSTEMDGAVPVQKEMAEAFESEGLPCEFIVTPNVGHWFPQDFGAQVDKAIGHIREQ